jgi:hypothetical protein
MREELASCRLLSRNWLGSLWCYAEAVTAAFRGKGRHRHRDRDLTGDHLERTPPVLSERQGIGLRDGDDRPAKSGFGSFRLFRADLIECRPLSRPRPLR